MDAATLQTFSRKKIQALAKKHGVKANLRTEDIIKSLLKECSGAVPRAARKARTSSKGQPAVKTTQQRRSARLSTSARLAAPQSEARPVAIPQHERSSASIVYDEDRSTPLTLSSPMERNRSPPPPPVDEDIDFGTPYLLNGSGEGPSTSAALHPQHIQAGSASPKVSYAVPSYEDQAEELLRSIAAAQPVAGPSKLSAVQYTPNRRHIITDDPKNPTRPRVFFLPGDPNRPSGQPATKSSAPHEQPGYPYCADVRHYSRECTGYMDEENDLDQELDEIVGIFNAAEKEQKLAQETLLEVRAIRLVLEKEYLPRLRPGSDLYDFQDYVNGMTGDDSEDASEDAQEADEAGAGADVGVNFEDAPKVEEAAVGGDSDDELEYLDPAGEEVAQEAAPVGGDHVGKRKRDEIDDDELSAEAAMHKRMRS